MNGRNGMNNNDGVLALYELLPISYNANDAYGTSLLHKTGNVVKCFNIDFNFEMFDVLKNDKIKYFLLTYKEVYFIPLELPDKKIFGFVLKAKHEKKFYNYKIWENYPMVYGLHDFYDYVFNVPVFMVEGIKDAQFIKIFYPYTIAYLTSSPSRKLFDYLTCISNRLVIIPDNDKAGRKNIYRYNKYAVHFCVVNNSKDFGEYWDYDDYIERQYFIDNLKIIFDLENISM